MNYEFSISNPGCTHIMHYHTKFSSSSYEFLIQLQQSSMSYIGNTSKFLSKQEVIEGLEGIISCIDRQKKDSFKRYKLMRFLESAVYQASESEVFYLHVPSEYA